MRNIHQYVCTVIPPHILRHVASHGDADDRQAIEATIAHTEELREERGNSKPVLNAHSGSTSFEKRRNVYDARHRQTLPGRLILNEKRQSTDIEAIEAYDGAGATLDFFARVFSRNSIDDRGLRIDSTVHYGTRFDNAMWNGRQIIYGDGDGKLFNRFTAAVDVIGHELTHGVTQYSAGLGYRGQTGALNEHLSDAFGIMVKQYALGQDARDSDWLIGEGLLGSGVQGKGVRSMSAPGTAYDDPLLGRDPQPAHMRGYVLTTQDNGGVHINCGIPNHAFYLAAVAAGGKTWEVVGRIWFAVLTGELSANARFHDFATATVLTAGRLYGVNSYEQRLVKHAWSEVGITVSKTSTQRIPIKTGRRLHGAAIRGPWPVPKWRNRPTNKH